MEEFFTFSQLVTQLSNTTKSEILSTGQGNDYTTGCLLDYKYFKDNQRPIAAGLSKQKDLNADSRAIQQITFGKAKSTVANKRVIIYYILE